MSSVILAGDTSGTITLQAPAVAGTSVLTLPITTDTLIGLATTDTLTNKTLTAPILTTPALGTPASGIMTNVTGTASGLTAGNVTTNANLTGALTSVGNATSLGSFTSAQLSGALTDETGTGVAVFATSPTLVTPALGTPASGVVTNLTGTASININGTVGATTPLAGAFTTLSATGTSTLAGVTATKSSGTVAAFTQTGATGYGLVIIPGADTVYDAFGINNAANTLNMIRMFGNGTATFAGGVGIGGAASPGSTGLAVTGTLSNTTGANFATASGNVGIGTTSPGAKLDVATSTAGYAAILTNTNGASDSNGLLVKAGTVSTEYNVRFANTGDTSTFMVVKGNGNVGIGTTSPSAKLHSYATSGTTTTLGKFEAAIGSYTGTSLIAANTLSASSAYNLFSCITDSDGDAGGPFTQFLVRGDGNVGIGTTDSSLFNSVGGTTRLAVCGSSASTDILGNTGASISIINTDTTANNTAGLHFARADTDDTPNYAGASIVAQFPETQVTGQYPKGLLAFLTSTAANNAPSEKMRIDASGNVGIGTSSPGAKLDVTNNQAALSYLIDTNNTTNGGSSIWRMITRNIANTGTTSVEFYKPTGSGFSLLNNDTNASNFTSFNVGASESMRIDSSGNVRVGTTTGNSDAKSTIYGGATDSSPCIELFKGSTTNTTAQVFARFQVAQATTPVASGSITSNGAASATFTAWSDIRLKENIVDLPSQLANIMALRPVEFDYIGYENGEGHQLGFIAQEVQEIYPDLVGEGADGMLMLSDMNKNDARLIKCIQELKAIIDTQATRIAALEELKH